MTQQTRLTGAEHADIFAEAAARVQEGEPLELVLASYPEAYQRNLRDLLAVVALATEISRVAVPALSPSRQSARKAAFLEVARRFHAEQEAIANLHPAPATTFVTPVPARQLPAVLAWWRDLFALPGLRPAAAALSAVLILLFATTLVTLAEAAVPGDVSYPVKQWIRSQQLYLAPADERPAVRAAQEQELIVDVQKAQQRADLRDVAITAEATLLFHGYGAGYYNIGDLVVLAGYEPDPNVSGFVEMPIRGELTPGATVLLRYRILPGQQAAHGPRVVQGISLEVLTAQPLEPTPLPKETLLPPPSPTAVDEPTRPPCTVTVPPGWIPYQVRIGDTLTAIAGRSGASVDDLRAVNCLNNDLIMAGRNILVPTTAPEPTVAVPTLTTATPTTLAPSAATIAITVTTSPAPETPEALTATPGAPLTVTTPAPISSLTATPDGAEPVTPTIPVTASTPVGATPDEPVATRALGETVTPEPDASTVATTVPVTGTGEAATPGPGVTPEPAEPTTEAEPATPLPPSTGTPAVDGSTPTPTATPETAGPDEPAASTPDTGGGSLPSPAATDEPAPVTATTDTAPSAATPAAPTTSTAPEPAPPTSTPAIPTAESAPYTPPPEPPTPVPPPTATQQPPPTQVPPPPPPPPPTQPPPDDPPPAPPGDADS